MVGMADGYLTLITSQRELSIVGTCSTVGKGAKRMPVTTVETTTRFNRINVVCYYYGCFPWGKLNAVYLFELVWMQISKTVYLIWLSF